jgi:chloramphenicol O-acetyltransferase type A
MERTVDIETWARRDHFHFFRTYERPFFSILVYFSAIPWISFTSFEHALQLPGDSNPRVVFGRHREVAGRRQMPVSLALHHALADGLHAGRFFESFQKGLDRAQEIDSNPTQC